MSLTGGIFLSDCGYGPLKTVIKSLLNQMYQNSIAYEYKHRSRQISMFVRYKYYKIRTLFSILVDFFLID